MAMTLGIVKPDAVADCNTGNILAHFEKKDFVIRGLKMLHLTTVQARAFYEVHRERPFYDSLVEFMTSGPVVPVALERDDAVAKLREVMGETDAPKASPGTRSSNTALRDSSKPRISSAYPIAAAAGTRSSANRSAW